ncbi:hypothetical protein LP421_13130 [Rhizobium sp. RCAM05350]|nr:hypothetical protein LP421_13130 [Rhizobium sp. RCAM05350]
MLLIDQDGFLLRAHLQVGINAVAEQNLFWNYADIFAPRCGFGQGTRIELANGVPNPVAGVTKKHLTDDVYLECNRVVNANTYLTAWFSVSFPGAGLDSMVGKKAPNWKGGFINVVVNF